MCPKPYTAPGALAQTLSLNLHKFRPLSPLQTVSSRAICSGPHSVGLGLDSIVRSSDEIFLRRISTMVQSAVLGFPRMGVNRDLKKATEACTCH